MEDPFISVIVPVCNTEKYLNRCLNSIITQSFPDFEIICIDDASSDNSYSILQKYKEKDCRIKVYRNKTNQGAGYTKNIAIKKTSGKYLCFIDSDDWIIPNTFKTLYAKAIDNNADDVFYLSSDCNEGIEKIIESEWSRYKFIDNHIYSGIDFLDGMIEAKSFTVGAVHHFCKRELVLKYASFSEHTINDDLQFTCCLLSNIKRVLFLNKYLYVYYHRRTGSISNKVNSLYFCQECINLGIATYNLVPNKSVAKKILKYNLAFAINKSLLLSNNIYKDIKLYGEQKTKENNVYNIFQEAQTYSLYTSDRFKRLKDLKSREVYIYGAGNYAVDIFRTCSAHEVKVKGFIVSNNSNNREEIAGIRVLNINSILPGSQDILIIGTSEKFYNEILSNQIVKQFKEIILAKEL